MRFLVFATLACFAACAGRGPADQTPQAGATVRAKAWAIKEMGGPGAAEITYFRASADDVRTCGLVRRTPDGPDIPFLVSTERGGVGFAAMMATSTLAGDRGKAVAEERRGIILGMCRRWGLDLPQ